MNPRHERRRQKSSVIVGLMLFQLVMILLQLWLFVGVLEGLSSGRSAMAAPAAIVSVLILATNVWMLVGVGKLDASE
ncbi:MAG: hypothetical protein KIS66_12485 [Fimbriimonadaceae bacterium]|nr:hypothetical protein [Fimbriimonadaceae bacterium]